MDCPHAVTATYAGEASQASDAVVAMKKERTASSQTFFDDAADLLRWVMDARLDLIEAVASDPQTFAPDAPGLDDALEGWRNPTVCKGNEEADAMFLTLTQVLTPAQALTLTQEEALEWWRGFPERGLLTTLARSAKRRKAECGSPHERRTPSQDEGTLIARPILVDVVKKSQFSFSQEAKAVAAALAFLHMPPFVECSPAQLRDYVRRSSGDRTYFDALGISHEGLLSRGTPIPCEIAKWRQEVDAGERRRPPGKPLPRGRPRIAAHLLRDIQIQFVIELLRRLGIPPRGRDFSGCRIVADVLKEIGEQVSEWDVELIWKKRVGTRHFPETLRKHSKATAQRTGPFHASPASEH